MNINNNDSINSGVPIPGNYTPEASPTRSSKKTLVIVLVALIVGGGGYAGAAYYMTNYQELPLWPFEAPVAPIPSFSPRPVASVTPTPMPTEAPIVVMDCGTDKNCFNTKLAQCQMAKFTTSSATSGTTSSYEITSPNGIYCFVKTQYITHPNSALVGKTMVCSLDPKKGFDVAVQDTRFCSGELYDLMYKK